MADLIFTGGGTGGHLYPALAVAEAARRLRPGVSILFVGTPDRIEAKVVPAQGWPFEAIPAKGLSKKPAEALQALETLGEDQSRLELDAASHATFELVS